MPVPDPTLINTPPIPADLRDFAITLTDNARTVLRKRYLRRGEDGQPAETEQGMFWRVAYNIALAEIEHGGTPDSVDQIARRFFHLLTALQFFPNSPTFTGAGTPLGQLAACFTADMRVTTSTGQTRIADLTVGDLVLTHEGRYRPVREVYQREYNDRLLRVKIHNIGTALEVTPEHPILTPRGWVKAGELKVGDQVAVGQLAETVQESYFAMAANGSSNANRYGYMSIADLRQREYIAIDQIASEHFEGLVYNCEVEDDHTYVTEGVVVHNCFVLAIDDDMGRTDTGIFQTLRNAALIQQTGGGNGFAFSRLRPKGAIVRSSNGQATGPVGFLRVYDQAFGEIAQGGCLTPDTLVFTDRGLLRLDEIVTQPRPGWYTHNMTVPTDQGDRQSTQGYNNGVAPVFQVTTEAGIQLTGTANHKIKVMTATGSQWRMIGDLQPGDQVMFKLGQHRGQIQTLRQPERIHANQIMPTFPEVLDADLAFLCGYLIATCDDFSDKGDDRMSVTVSRKHAATFERMPNLIHDLFGANVVLDMQFAANDTVRYIIDDQAVKQFLLSNGLLNQKPTADRAIPRLIRQSPADVASAFLDGLFEASELGGEDKDVLANSKRMTQEMYTLIIGLGFAPLYRQTSESNARKSVATSGKAVRVVGNVDVLEPGHPTDDLWFTSIASIEAVGESVTLDLEVEDNHTYLANGMVVHNSRRGANMAVLRVDHPDVRDFINCKTNESNITNFNISVGITDAFMRAVESDGMYDLINPQDESVWETVRAREIYDLIVKNAHHNGEPGVLFLDAANRQNPVPHLYRLESTNPCGEQWLGPFENCCLGSINVATIATDDGKVDWEKFRDLIETSTRFLDDVVTANNYVPAVPQLKEAAHRVRRIGLGIMGLADLMYALGVRYGSEEGQEFAGQLTEFLRYHAMKTSIGLAQQRGAFPAITGSIYDPQNMVWQPPKPLFPFTRNYNRPHLDWSEIVSGIKQYGIRNGACLTVAPTGTIATVSGCEGYGCEPVFALAYIRHVNDQGRDLQLQYTSPLLEKALHNANLSADQIAAIIAEVNATGTCQDIADIPEHIRHTFVVSSDIGMEEHVRMQAAMQAFLDNSLSKTINAPPTATEADVAAAYMLGWKLGCKGMTVYVTGSRDKVVLETHATAQTKQADAAPNAIEPTIEPTAESVPETITMAAAPAPIPQITEVMPTPASKPVKKSRPHKLIGRTYRVETPLGKTYVTINENGEGLGYPFEIFTHTSKAGSDTAAVSEAIGRLISLMLRLRAPLTSPRDRLKEIAHELDGIGGGRPTGFGAARVRSLPDGIARVLQEYLDETEDNLGAPTELPPKAVTMAAQTTTSSTQATLPAGEAKAAMSTSAKVKSNGDRQARIIGDLCPECGEATLVNEEGCRKCYTCGYSEC